MDIRELRTEAELRSAFPVMQELRSHLDEDEYVELLGEMIPRGYRLFALFDDAESIAALAGITFATNFYYGRYVWVFDLITRADARSGGFGGKLLTHIEELARHEGCDMIALSSALHRLDAHRFYTDRGGYEKSGFTFQKAL